MASDYGEGIINRLHPDSPLRQEGNPARTLIMKTIGAWLDNYDVTELYDNGFLETATGKWLDLYGRDLGVVRQLDESDEDYRTRLIYESVGNLSMDYLLNVFDLSLYSFREDFNVEDNTLVSDNPFLNTGGYISVADDDVISIMDRKLLLDGSVSWVTEYGSLGYILNTQGINILSHYSEIFHLTDLEYYFMSNNSIKEVKLVLHNVIDCESVFARCSNLVSIDLNLLKVTNCKNMFWRCSSLVNVNLNLPEATDCMSMFDNCSDLVSIDLTLPKAILCASMFYKCSDLVSVDLNLPNVTNCAGLFDRCSSLTNVKLNSPKLNNYDDLFVNATNIETIDVTIPTSKVNGFKSYVLGLNLQHLTSFKINGEEQL